MSSSVGTVSALCRNLTELGVLLLCRCRDLTPSKKFMSHGTTSPYISLSLIAEAIEAIEVIEAIEAIGAIEAIWGNGDHVASIASIAPAIEAIGAI